jgi:hypothetical protein
MRHPFWKSALVGVWVVASLLLIPRTGHAADDDKVWEPVLEISRLYEDLEYEQALSLVQRARRVTQGVDRNVVLSLYEGILLCELGNVISGQTAFHKALWVQPESVLPKRVAPKVEKYFEATRLAVEHERALISASSEPAGVENPSAGKGRAAPVQVDARKTAGPHVVNEERTPSSADSAETSAVASSQPTQAEIELATEAAALMKRVVSLASRFRGRHSFSTRDAFRELSAIARKIEAAQGREALQDASTYMDLWEAQYLLAEQ